MRKIALLLLGGALGTAGRYYLSVLVYALGHRPSFPIATLIVNVTGCFLIGLLSELFAARALATPEVQLALVTGVLGGYTTFSSFAYETLALVRNGELALAGLNVAGSVVLGLAAAWVGIRLVQAFA